MAGVRIRHGFVCPDRGLVRAIRPLLGIALLLLLPAVAQAQFTFTTNNGAITITGYSGPGGTVIIPSATNGYPVTSIGDDAFYDCYSLTSVTIPNSVITIGSGAFTYCTNLTSVTIPNSLTTIGDQAFFYCSRLTSVTFPNSVTNIGDYAFTYCTSLSSVTIPNSVTSIGNTAFYSCSSLTNVTIGTNVTNIGDEAFAVCARLTAITVDALNPVYSSVDGVLFNQDQSVLIQCPGGKAGGYTISNSVTSIGNSAFYSCSSLTNVTIGTNVANIGDGAFRNCFRLTNVTIPNSVTNIGDSAFGACNSLTSIMVDTNNPSYSSVAGVLFDKSQTALIEYPGGLNGSYTILNSVTNIGYAAFAYCIRLASVTIPNSVTSIGDGAFAACGSLTSVTIGNSITNIGFDAFSFCSSLTGVYFTGNSLTSTSDLSVFRYSTNAMVYYLPGTTGWGPAFDGRPTALWFLPNPLILNHSPSLGVQTNQFGFTISWATNIPVVVEACTNLANPAWNPVATNPLTGGTSYFSDPQWTNYPGRFYRLRSP